MLFIFILFSIFTFKKTAAQNHISSNIKLSKKDTLIVNFLLKHNQFYNIPSSDTLNSKKFILVKGNYFFTKIFSAQKGGKKISLYGFGTNYSHSRNYLLIKMPHLYKILGASSLEYDLTELYNLFDSLKPCIRPRQKVACYEFLIQNYNLHYPPPTHLIKDQNYKKTESSKR